MKTQQSGIRQAVAAAFLAGSFFLGSAWAGPMDTAQDLALTGTGGTVSGSVTATVVGGSALVYSFWAGPTDVIEVDVDTNGSGLDTIASVHGTDSDAIPYKVERVVDDSMIFPFDEGSMSPLDPLIQGWVPLTEGIHYVVVTIASDRVADGGIFVNGGATGMSGTVTLNVTCVASDATVLPCAPSGATTGGTETPPVVVDTPPETPTETTEVPTETTTPPATEVKFVNIDVRPGSRSLVRLNPKWKAVIPVAIMSTRGFNVRDVDAKSLTFGSTGDEDSLRNCNKRFTKVHRHRYALVCYFENAKAGFELGDEEGVLRGTLKDGTPIEGRAMLKVLPEKRKYGHRHGKGHDKHAENGRGHRRHSH